LMKYFFPDDFLWGASISSYQTEGNNINSDWYVFEKKQGLVSSGEACRHFELYKDDFLLAKRLSLKALRFSLEWARIEPEPGRFSAQALSHYKAQIRFLKSLGIKPVLTLHHFTNPQWFAEKGGWTDARNIDYFLRYVSYCLDHLAEDIYCLIVINEPAVYIYNGFISGCWPPGEKSFAQARIALNNMIKAYVLAYRDIKSRTDLHNIPVSLAKNMIQFSPCPKYNFGQNHLSAFLRSRFYNDLVLDRVSSCHALDFLGVNYYSRQFVRCGPGILGKECSCPVHRERKNYLGWYVSAAGFLAVLRKLKRFRLPVIITENGTAEKTAGLYEPFLLDHLRVLARAICEGLDCRGYFWWSLLDNFEWDKGFGPGFGLAHVDYSSYERHLRPFALRYKEIIENNALTG